MSPRRFWYHYRFASICKTDHPAASVLCEMQKKKRKRWAPKEQSRRQVPACACVSVYHRVCVRVQQRKWDEKKVRFTLQRMSNLPLFQKLFPCETHKPRRGVNLKLKLTLQRTCPLELNVHTPIQSHLLVMRVSNQNQLWMFHQEVSGPYRGEWGIRR